MNNKQLSLCYLAMMYLFCLQAANAVVSRPSSGVGEIVSARGDSKIQFTSTVKWLTAEVEQQLLAGDNLRTGQLGTMALLFSDRTQIQLHRNSFLTVKAIAGKGSINSSLLRLDKGSIWSRASKGKTGVKIETPSATAAIRGTDWSLSVDINKRTTLIVLDGEVALENAFGRIIAKRGEIAFAEIGKAPTKTIIVHPSDRAQIIYNFSLPDAYRSFPLSNLKTARRRAARAQLESITPGQRSISQSLELAELAYDMGDRQISYQILHRLSQNSLLKPAMQARLKLLEGYLAVFDASYANAETILAKATLELDPERALAAKIARTIALIMLRRTQEAEELLKQMKLQHSSKSKYWMLQTILTAFSGNLTEASQIAHDSAKRFPDQAEFPVYQGILALLLDDREQALESAEQALAIDSELAFAYVVKGYYLADYKLDHEGAINVYKKGLLTNENSANLWGSMGLAYLELGEERKAEVALQKAIQLVPDDIASLSNYIVLLLDQYRLIEASETIQKIQQIEDERDLLLLRQGRLAMQTGDIKLSEEYFLKATTVNPIMSEASLGLAISYYEQGDLLMSKQTLANASRLDGIDPLIPLVSSIIARDRSEADTAIIEAREAIRRYREQGVERGFTGLAANSDGANSLGSSFENLNLSSWGNYYNELSFEPYSADSHFYRSNNANIVFSELIQGLTLDPLAGSARNRYIDFFRRPFNDAEIEVSQQHVDKGTGHGGSANVQGFSQDYLPMSYYFSIESFDSPGHLNNSDSRNTTVNGLLGMYLTPYDRVLVDLNATDSDRDLPGSEFQPDEDDNEDTSFWKLGLSYSHFFSARNVILTRASFHHLDDTFTNGTPFGTDLSSLDYSLINNFGIDGTEVLHNAGLQDVSINPNSPLILVGIPPFNINNTLQTGMDVSPVAKTRIKRDSTILQARHMFTLGNIDYSYGAEGLSFKQNLKTESLNFQQRNPGTGLLSSTSATLPFLFGDAELNAEKENYNGIATSTHFDALYRARKNIWLEGAMFINHYDDDLEHNFTHYDPRGGIAWAVDNSNWLRVAVSRDSLLPFISSLAPIGTVGIVPNHYFVDIGGHATTYTFKWDSEWTAQLFTSFEIARQDIDDFSAGIPGHLVSLNVSKGRIEQLKFDANLWLKGGFGLFAEMNWRRTENRSNSFAEGYDLPLVPERELNAGITWVHPQHIRVSMVSHFVDEYSADLIEFNKVESYATTNLLMSWQPLNKKVELSLNLYNLFDKDYDYAFGYPAPGRTIEAAFKMRF